MIAKLREAIINGSLRPGDRLTYRDLAQRFGVSVTPIRIALRELSNEGLVEMRPHTGTRVSPLSVDEIEEIFATRIGIEGWLARYGTERLTDANLRAMARALDELRKAERRGDLDAYLRHSWEMRAVCYGAAEKPRLFERFRVLYEHSSRYVFLMIADTKRLRRSRRTWRRSAPHAGRSTASRPSMRSRTRCRRRSPTSATPSTRTPRRRRRPAEARLPERAVAPPHASTTSQGASDGEPLHQ